MKRLFKVQVALFLLLNLGISSSAQAAGLLMSIDDIQLSGSSGTFEVLLANTESPTGKSYDISSFTFEVAAPAGSSMQFTDATIATAAAPYLFDGTGQGAIDPAFTLPVDPSLLPSSGLVAADSQFVGTGPLGDQYFTTIAPGVTFSLGLVSFTFTPGEPPAGLVPSLVAGPGTSLSDVNGKSINFSFPDAAVPEPSSLVMTLVGVGILLVPRRRRTQGEVSASIPRE